MFGFFCLFFSKLGGNFSNMKVMLRVNIQCSLYDNDVVHKRQIEAGWSN